MKIFWIAQILEMAESDIFCAKSGADYDAAIEIWLWLFFAEIWVLPCPKNALQNAPEDPVVNALFGKPLRAKGDCHITETYLKSRSRSGSLRKAANCQKLRSVRCVTADFVNMKNRSFWAF